MRKRDYIVIELSKEMELAISNLYEERRAKHKFARRFELIWKASDFVDPRLRLFVL